MSGILAPPPPRRAPGQRAGALWPARDYPTLPFALCGRYLDGNNSPRREGALPCPAPAGSSSARAARRATSAHCATRSTLPAPATPYADPCLVRAGEPLLPGPCAVPGPGGPAGHRFPARGPRPVPVGVLAPHTDPDRILRDSNGTAV